MRLAEVAGFLLAGGMSSRMGRDKALLQLDGETLVERGLGKLRQVCAEVAILGGDGRLASYGRVIPDERPGCGPLGGIVAALEQSEYEWNVVLAVDMPFVPVSVLEELVAGADEACVAVMVEAAGQVQPLCAVYSRRAVWRFREELDAGRWQVRAAAEAAGTVKFLQLPDGMWFCNVNTPEEFAGLGEGLRGMKGRSRDNGLRGDG